MEISGQGLSLIRKFEGFSATPYTCPAGKLTIGYGHVIAPGEEFPPSGIDEEAAETLLLKDVNGAAQAVTRYVTVELLQCRFDALVSFAYNVGSEAFEKSTLLRLINQGEFTAAAAQFGRWIYAGDRKIPGLMARREAESTLFSAS